MAKVGRPARISREAIAEAANDIGLSDLTLRAVADRLGVSIASLYHHVEGKDDLLRLAAEYSAARTSIPQDEGQHWAVWLLEWALYNRDAFVAEPALFGQFMDGAIGADVMADNTEAILARLVAQGFTAREAQSAYQLVSGCALGAAIQAIREQRAAVAGRPAAKEYLRLLADREPGDLPHLRALLAEAAVTPLDSFETRITTVLAGIAARRGEDWSAIVTNVERLLTAHG
ncbi:MAG: TetR/AcrR family transcriptional regulator C-terminal domain-containing protein [Acidimicrobiales bacterium]